MKLFLWLTLLACGSVVSAHSELVSSSPTDASVVQNRPAAITLTFSEAIEPSFSSFVVYPLTEADQAALGTEREAFLARALSGAGSNEIEVKPDAAGASETLTLPLPETLEPGVYAVLWRALSVDTYTLQDFIVFSYRP